MSVILIESVGCDNDEGISPRRPVLREYSMRTVMAGWFFLGENAVIFQLCSKPYGKLHRQSLRSFAALSSVAKTAARCAEALHSQHSL